jgi:hypothetical protein
LLVLSIVAATVPDFTVAFWLLALAFVAAALSIYRWRRREEDED